MSVTEPTEVAVQASDVLAVRGLSVSYRRRGRTMRVVSDVDLTIRRGEAYGLVGGLFADTWFGKLVLEIRCLGLLIARIPSLDLLL